MTHYEFITHRYYVKGWVKPDADAGSTLEADPHIYDRVCQQALKNRLEPIFDPLFDDANFGYRVGRSTKDALRKVWREIEGGNEWIIDADLRDLVPVNEVC